MSKRATILGFGVLALIAGALALFGSRSREPVFQGRTLTSWLAQRDDASPVETQRTAEAKAAVRAIGAPQALPFLLGMAETRDSPLRRWLIQTMEGRRLGLRISEARRIQRLGLYGFEILGTNGAPAIPELVRLMIDTNEATIALECLARIGKPAEVPVCQALTNSDPGIRCLSVSLLAHVTGDTGVLLARLKQCLQDPAAPVRRAAVEGIGAQSQAPDDAVPLLVSALDDQDEDVASSAAKLLANFGTNAMRAFPALTNAVEVTSDATANRALRALVIIAPDEALPIVLKCVRSPLPHRKSNALAMLGEYKMATP